MFKKYKSFKDLMGALCKSAAKVQQIFETTKYFVYFLHFFVIFLQKQLLFALILYCFVD
jgi:hypothetical protein